MTSRGLVRGVAEAWEVPRDLLLGRYPPFVTGGPLRPDEVPVFVLHGTEPESFERRLRHLSENGYSTLSIAEYVAVIRGDRRPRPRSVLLTFDDGRGSVWTIAAPLLRRHGMRAVVFLVPGRMRPGPGGLSPTWDDVQVGRCQADVLLAREQGEGALLSWDEVEALERMALFDFQSHTAWHARIHTGPQLAGFATPRSREGCDGFDQPLVRHGERDLIGREVPLGTPLFRSAPRTSHHSRFFEDPAVRRRPVELVVESGGEAFFEHPDWERRLRRTLRGTVVGGKVETAQERVHAIALELSESRRRIEEHTGRPVVHLCYPWHVADSTTRRLAEETGYLTGFCGKVAGVPITMPGGDLRSIARIGEDYLELLPGSGRATIIEVLRQKWQRRFGDALR